jgi:predicted dehydrogenase
MPARRLGFIGAGAFVERNHLLAVAEVPELAVVAVCRRDAGRLAALADRFRIPKRYTDYRDLLADPEIEAVLIATGPASQPDIALAAVAAGKHVFAEKPLAETSAQARRLAQAAAGAAVQVQVVFNKRLYPGDRRAKRLIGDGELGVPSGISARFWFQPGRADPLLHNGLHFLDLVQFLMGPATEVQAWRAVVAGDGSPGGETMAVSLRFGGGAVGTLLLSSLAS